MRLFFYIISVIFFVSCSAVKNSFSAAKRYSPEQLQEDYSLYRKTLEAHHPSLYWYTSKDSMDNYFEWGRQQLNDSLTEPQFRKVLTYVTAKINCGHTTVRPSKSWSKYTDTVRLGKMFPLSLKTWAADPYGDPENEMMVVTANLNRRDSILRRGTPVTKINGYTKAQLVDTLFNYISTDGYNRTHKYQSLSNRGFFSSLFTSLYGSSARYAIEYQDSTGAIKTITIPAYDPATDTVGRGTRTFRPSTPQPSKKERRELRLNAIRLLRIDTVARTAMMDLASFGRGFGLKRFYRNSFRVLRQNNIDHLIIDVRSNGGGSVTNSTLISRFIAKQRFRIADSLYATRKASPYQHLIQDHFWNKLFISFFTKKRRDGNYHFGYFERHYFKPKKNNHYKGQVYILTGGNSFSAATLFTSALINQDNVTVVGEETGGGAYGNSAWLIPDVTLPETKVRFRLPIFRLVIDQKSPKNGRGVQPEVESFPTVELIKRNVDYKVEKAMELIRKDKQKASN